METTTIKTTSGTSAATKALAVVGFIVLVLLGMALAVYAARFIPELASRLGSAAVYVSSEFEGNNGEDPNLVVVPPTDSIPFGEGAATTSPTTTAPVAVVPPTPSTPVPPTYPSYPVYGGYTPPPAPFVIPVQVPASQNWYGLPDLVIENVVTGYLNTSDTDSFRASDEVPDGERGAVRFTIANRGTDVVTDTFEFEVELPTERSYTYTGRVSRDIRPGERITYTLGFTQPDEGRNQEISIEVDTDDDVRESDERNNDRTVEVDIED